MPNIPPPHGTVPQCYKVISKCVFTCQKCPFSTTKLYHLNGKIMEKGQSKLDVSDVQRHWYYFGDWKYYDEKGKLKYIKKYANGKKIDSISFQN